MKYYVISTNDYGEQKIVGRHDNYEDARNEKRRRDRKDRFDTYRIVKSARVADVGVAAGEGVPIL